MKNLAFASVLVVSVALLLMISPASGYPVTVRVEGVVTIVVGWGGVEQDGSVILGETIMTGYFTYDTDTPDQYPGSSSTGLYSLISISMTAGSYTFVHDPAGDEDPYFYISTGAGGFYYDIRSPSPVFYGPCYFNGQPTTLEDLNLPVRGISWYLRGYNDGTITDALPDENTFPDLSVFTEEARFGSGGDGSLGFGVGADITSLTVVPEPPALPSCENPETKKITVTPPLPEGFS